MNTNRIDTVLNRQKTTLIFDSVYAAIIVVGLLISLFGLSTSPALARTLAPADVERPAVTHVDAPSDCVSGTQANYC